MIFFVGNFVHLLVFLRSVKSFKALNDISPNKCCEPKVLNSRVCHLEDEHVSKELEDGGAGV